MSIFYLFIFLFIVIPCFNSLNYYILINSSILINFVPETIYTDELINLFPLYVTFSDDEKKGYYKLGKSNNFNSSISVKNSNIQKGDIVLLEDNSYALFYDHSSTVYNYIYLGNINYNYINQLFNSDSHWFVIEDSILVNESLKNGNNEECYTNLYGNNVDVDLDCDMFGDDCDKETEITIFNRNGRFEKIPSLYLNENFFSNQCKMQDFNKSIKCIVDKRNYPGKVGKEHNIYELNLAEFKDGCNLINILTVYINSFYIFYAKYLILLSLLML